MTEKHGRPAGTGRASGDVLGGASSDLHRNICANLTQLAGLAEDRATSAPTPELRRRARRLYRYVIGRLARRALRVRGRARLDTRGAEVTR